MKEPRLLDVELDDVGKAAEKYINIKDDIEDLKIKEELAEEELIQALTQSKRFEIIVKGRKLQVRHIEAKVKISCRDLESTEEE